MPTSRSKASKFGWLILLLAVLNLNCAGLSNTTIDDEFGDSVTGQRLEYAPPNGPGSWIQGSTCDGCISQQHVSPAKTHLGTWRESIQSPGDSAFPSITAHFTGTAVYVFNILDQFSAPSPGDSSVMLPSVTYLTFEMDGVPDGEFLSTTYSGVRYNVPVYSKDHLPDGPHTLVIRIPPGPDGNSKSYVLLDYIEYTPSDPAHTPSRSFPSTSSTTPTTAQSTDSFTLDHLVSVSTPLTTIFTFTSENATSLGLAHPAASNPSFTTADASTSPPSPNSSSRPDLAPASSDNKSSSSSLVGRAVGGGVGGVAILAIAGSILLYFKRRRRLIAKPEKDTLSGAPPFPYTEHQDFSSLLSRVASQSTIFDSTLETQVRAASKESSQADMGSSHTHSAPSDPPGSGRGIHLPSLASPSPHESDPENHAHVGEPLRVVDNGPQLQAQVAALERRVMRMQELMEAPPTYEFDASRRGEANEAARYSRPSPTMS